VPLELAAVYHRDPDLQRDYRALATSAPVRMGEGVMGKVIADDRALLLPRVDPEDIVARAPAGYREAARRLDVHSYVGVPMHARGRVIGGISLARGRGGAPYGEDDRALLQDLADRAALALENARLYASLERRVAEATARLQGVNRELLDANRKLRVARDHAEEVSRELEAFSYSVAHDLRAPLRSIDGFSAALMEDYGGKLGGSGETYLRYVRDSAQQMGRLIDDLLKLSRVTRSELSRERVDLTAMARAIAARLARGEPARDVEVVVADDLIADGDASLLSVVLENLIGNAWKFTGKRERARIEIGVRADQRPPVFFVRDNGAGFDMAYAHRLFGAFQRLHTPREFEGNGIGLASVHRIIRRHGGRVWAEGAIDAGATISFTLEGALEP